MKRAEGDFLHKNSKVSKEQSAARLGYAICVVFAAAFVFIVIGIVLPNSAQNKETPYISTEHSEPSSKNNSASTDNHSSKATEKTPWNLILVNRWNTLPDDYKITLKQLQNGLSVDKRCYKDLQDMMNDCRANGLSPVICSAYRSMDKQIALFDKQVNKWLAKGYSRQKAEQEAAKLVAVPGSSEHQLGLAMDIVDISNQILDERQENTDVQKWLMKNSWKYGFILRYPTDKSDITGISYEPWHYRYVGKKAAKEIYERNICLEEYLT